MTELMQSTSKWLLDKYSFLFKSIVQVYSFKDNVGTGSGTGFFIQKDEALFLCTNKHVIATNEDVLNGNKRIVFSDELKAQIYLKNGEIMTLCLPIADNSGAILENIHLHPASFVDIVAIDITSSELNLVLDYIDISYFDCEKLLVPDREIIIDNKVYVLGYPHGNSFTSKNYPLASEVLIRELNKSPFDFPDGVSIVQKDFVDSHFLTLSGELYKGMSGAPIIILPNEQNKLADGDYLIAGICAIFNDDNSKSDAYKSASILQIFYS